MPSLTLSPSLPSPSRLPLGARLPAAPSAAADVAALDTRALLGGRKAVTLVHNGMAYRLQATRMGKLILTK